MAYEYDIFVSYKREYKRWVQEIFLDAIELPIAEELGRKPKVFMDTADINTGDDWSERLYSGLTKSKCMIAFWTPQYFTSKWCLKEFAAMLYRQKQIKKTPQGLIFPINLNDGDSFHPEAKKLNYTDCRDFVYSNISSLKGSPKILDFEDRIRPLVSVIGNVIKNAPNFNPDWATPKWLEQPYKDLSPLKPATITSSSKLWVR